MNFWREILRFHRMSRTVSSFNQLNLPGFYFLSFAVRNERRVVPIQLGIFCKIIFANVARHKEIVTPACNASANRGNFTQRHETLAITLHDSEIEIGRSEIFAPFTAAVSTAI